VKIQRTLQINSFVPKDGMRRHSDTMRVPVTPIEQPLEIKRRELVVGRAPTCDPNDDPLVQLGGRCEIGLCRVTDRCLCTQRFDRPGPLVSF
jgi:hypothetical protein